MGNLTPEMQQTIAPFVQGREVWDLGAGMLNHSILLRQLGASLVVAVDKDLPQHAKDIPGVRAVRHCFQDVPPPGAIDVVFMSWIPNYACQGLMELIWDAQTIIYLGCNTDGMACGTPALFAFFLAKFNMVATVPLQENTLIVYQRAETPERRDLLLEEYAVLSGELLYWRDVAGKTFPLPVQVSLEVGACPQGWAWNRQGSNLL